MFIKTLSLLILAISVGITLFYQQYVLNSIHYRPVDLSNKIALVTGGTSGIGLETVRKLIEWNATVIMPVRNLKKGELVKNELLQTSIPRVEGSLGTIELLEMDLTSFTSIKKFVTQLIQYSKVPRLDIIILNAGMQSDSKSPIVTDDGIEVVYQVNHLSHYLLIRLLLPFLSTTSSSTSPCRIVHVSSSMHYIGSLDHEAYSSTSKNIQPSRLGVNSYSDTKLMNVIFSNALQAKLHQLSSSSSSSSSSQYSHITSVSVHPGLVISELDRGTQYATTLKKLRELIARPTVDGAIAQVTIATLPEIIQMGGGLYFEDHCIMSNCKKSILSFLVPVYEKGGVTPHSTALNITEQEWLWNTSSDIVGLPRDLFEV